MELRFKDEGYNRAARRIAGQLGSAATPEMLQTAHSEGMQLHNELNGLLVDVFRNGNNGVGFTDAMDTIDSALEARLQNTIPAPSA